MEDKSPEKRFAAGAISAAVWKNSTVKDSAYYTISIQRSYKDKEGKWQHVNSFRVSDLPKASLVLNKAYEYLLFKENLAEA